MAQVLIAGGDGPIGRALTASLGDDARVTTRRVQTIDQKRLFLDFSDPTADFSKVPDAGVVVIAAAMAKFADCRENPELARQINVLSPERLAREAIRRGAHVLLLSTAAVLDCQEPGMKADRPRAPSSDYGRFKAEAEERLLALGNAVSVLRLTKVVDPGMTFFINFINALRKGETISAFADLTLAPLAMEDVVSAVLAVISDRGGGIYQASGARDISYADAACHVARRLKIDSTRILPGSIADKGISRADAPPFTSLDASRLESIVGWSAPQPESVIDRVFGLEGA